MLYRSRVKSVPVELARVHWGRWGAPRWPPEKSGVYAAFRIRAIGAVLLIPLTFMLITPLGSTQLFEQKYLNIQASRI